jgi:hypothetical protein
LKIRTSFYDARCRISLAILWTVSPNAERAFVIDRSAFAGVGLCRGRVAGRKVGFFAEDLA